MKDEDKSTTQSFCAWLLSLRFWPAILIVWLAELIAAGITLLLMWWYLKH
jgi:hypothetical protein